VCKCVEWQFSISAEHVIIVVVKQFSFLLPKLLSVVLLQGLFHPARKVRDVYWKVYNTIYIGAQDSMIPAYPRIPNDPKNRYIRYELDYIL